MLQTNARCSPPYRPSTRTLACRRATDGKLKGLAMASGLAMMAFTVMVARLLF